MKVMPKMSKAAKQAAAEQEAAEMELENTGSDDDSN
jgi:recombination protein RecA